MAAVSVKRSICKRKKEQLCTCSTLFCTLDFLCRCCWNVKLPSYTFYGEIVVCAHQKKFVGLYSCSLFFHCSSFSPGLAASVANFLATATKCSYCSSNEVRLLCFLISHSSSLSLFFSLSFNSLSPTFSFSLSFPFSIFQICGLDN